MWSSAVICVPLRMIPNPEEREEENEKKEEGQR
jgi:hypothetical protein